MKGTLYFLFIFSFLSTQTLTAQTPACLGEEGKLRWLIWENISSSRLEYLTSRHDFPNDPDAYENISSIKSPGDESSFDLDGSTVFNVRYSTSYGSLIRGYIKPTETGNYTFNITGDDESRFHLSTDDTKENLILQAFIENWTYRDEYNRDTETGQTSADINLQANQYYYFEVWHKEGSGGDHVQVKWKTPSNTTNWQEIKGENIYDYGCDCPPSGTTCDDGDANTINDQEDGFCNCVGIPANAPSCVGAQGEIRAFYYLEIPGSSMNNLYDADKYPLMPDTTEILDILNGPLVNRDTYGTRISGLIKVPVTGDYQFSLTCDDRASFKLSTSTSPDDASEIAFSSWSSQFDQYRRDGQISDPVTLNKDNFYYFEMNHKEGTGGDRYSVFWRTPFMQDTLWRFIDKTYLYEYTCEMACIPEGTPCDDNNNFTKNDRYDANCNCAGIPCRGSDCDETPPLDYTPTPECGISEKTDNSAIDAWESCTPSANPNPARGTSHWIQYDLGQEYLLNESHIWNYNVEGAIGKGFKDVVIDYSSDGTNWTQLGDMLQWAQAPGTIGYEGFSGPHFNGVIARYILITALNNWDNGACSGFSKITFSATDCLMMGQDCDDGDPNSVNDRYDEHCNCIGEGEGIMDCGVPELVQGNNNLESQTYRAVRITSEGIIPSGNNVQLIAGESITLLPNFVAQAGSEFLATIENCNASAIVPTELTEAFSKIDTENGAAINHNKEKKEFIYENQGKTKLKIWPNPTQDWTSIHFNLPYATTASIEVYTNDGRKIISLSDNQAFAKGAYTKEFPAQRLTQGMYLVVLKTEQEILTKPLVIIK